MVRNLSTARNVATGGNLILAIQSPPGEGKTYHCKAVLGSLGVRVYRFPIADLESPGAGLPAVRLVERYVEAARTIEQEGPAALLIEDADLGIGHANSEAEITQFTMNRNLILGSLMGICDSPTLVDVPSESVLAERGGRTICPRVPIIMTGNNLGGVYPALFRDGRAQIVDWRASATTKIAFLELRAQLDPRAGAQLVKEFDDAPIAFWESVISHVEANGMRSIIADLLVKNESTSLAEMMEAAGILGDVPVTYEAIWYAAHGQRTLRENWSAT